MNEQHYHFRGINPGIETFSSSFSLPRHRHLRAYATVVLAGSFEEAGYAGRIFARAGDVLIHPSLDCHANPQVRAGLKLIRLEWPDSDAPGGFHHLEDVDFLARAAEKSARDASLLLENTLNTMSAAPAGRANDWPDLLATALTENPATGIGNWAEANGLARETVSRGFGAVYGITPIVFRAEVRARSAWLRIRRTSDSLSKIATETGFTDQAHMTRWVRRIAGAPPSAWRRLLR